MYLLTSLFLGGFIIAVEYYFILLVQLWLTLTLFLFKMVWRRWFLDKFWSSRFKEHLPTFVDKFLLKGGLNLTIFFLWLRLLRFLYEQGCTLIFVGSKTIVALFHGKILIPWIFAYFLLFWEFVLYYLENC